MPSLFSISFALDAVLFLVAGIFDLKYLEMPSWFFYFMFAPVAIVYLLSEAPLILLIIFVAATLAFYIMYLRGLIAFGDAIAIVRIPMIAYISIFNISYIAIFSAGMLASWGILYLTKIRRMLCKNSPFFGDVLVKREYLMDRYVFPIDVSFEDEWNKIEEVKKGMLRGEQGCFTARVATPLIFIFAIGYLASALAFLL